MKNILCFGDSNTWGHDVASPTAQVSPRMAFDVRWPGVLQNLLGGEWRIIEDGLPARTNVMEDPYFPHRRGLPALEAALDAHAPLDLVIIHTGVNELKHLFGLSAGMIALGAEKMVAAAREPRYGYPRPKVLLVAPAPLKENVADLQLGYSFGPLAYVKSLELGRAYKDVAERCGCGFIDCAELGFELNSLDGVHYSASDHLKLGQAAEQKARKMLS